MKYAFILGSNAFITNHPSISYTENGETKEFLRITGTKKNKSGVAGVGLMADINVKDQAGNLIISNGAKNIDGDHDRIRINNPDGTIAIDVHELSEVPTQHLSHHITAELDAENVIAVVRVFGHFMVGDYHINIDNEKLFIDDNSYAESVQVEHNGGIVFTKAGVLL